MAMQNKIAVRSGLTLLCIKVHCFMYQCLLRLDPDGGRSVSYFYSSMKDSDVSLLSIPGTNSGGHTPGSVTSLIMVRF